MLYRDQVPTQIFDCDGVILNSNSLKQSALRSALTLIGVPSAFIDWAVNDFRMNFGKTRINHFKSFREAAEKESIKFTPEMMSIAVSQYSQHVVKLYKSCELIKETVDYIEKLPVNSSIFVVSASDQSELRSILPLRLPRLSEQVIYGGPTSKVGNIMKVLEMSENTRCTFYGDAVQDARASMTCGVEFRGLTKHSADPQSLISFCESNNLMYFQHCSEVPVL